jgi:hypothetical protein
MKIFKSLAIAAAMLGANALATPAMAQELPVKNGSVWVASPDASVSGLSVNRVEETE